MKLDIRSDEVNDISFFKLWFADSFRKLRMVYTKEQIPDDKLKAYLVEKYKKRYTCKGRFYNNQLKTNKILTIEEFVNMFLQNKDYILTGYNCIFKSQKQVKSVAIKAVEKLLDERKKNKKKMLEYTEGTYWYIKYNVDQLAFKRSANSYYGVSGMQGATLYNSFVQNSITLTGRDLITTSISSNESFLSNSNKFNNIDEMFEFINNIRYEKQEHNILHYVDRSITNNELTDYLCSRFYQKPNREMIQNIVSGMNDLTRTKIFYKNQIDKLFENKYFADKLLEYKESKIYGSLDDKGDPHSEPEFRNIVGEFTFYNYLLFDRYNRAMFNKRNRVVTVDTDSNFLYLQPLLDSIATIQNDHSEETQFCNLYMLIDILNYTMEHIFDTATGGFGIQKEYRPIINMKNELTKWLLLVVTLIENFLNCWNGNRSAAKDI